HVDPATEWADKTDGTILVDEEFLDFFEKLRAMVGEPLPITSGYRSPAHNLQMPDHTDDGAHTLGRAADIAVAGEVAFHVLAIGVGLGATGVGVNQKGESPFLHLDIIQPGGHLQRPAIWSY